MLYYKVLIHQQFIEQEFKNICLSPWDEFRNGKRKKNFKAYLLEFSPLLIFIFQVQFEDPNVIELIGVVTRNDKFMIITEYMKNGSLKEYLKVSVRKY